MNEYDLYMNIIPINPPMYKAELNIQTGILTIKRDDKNGKLTLEEVNQMFKSKEVIHEQTNDKKRISTASVQPSEDDPAI